MLFTGVSTALPPLTLPDVFYVSFTVNFDSAEFVNAFGAPVFGCDGTSDTFFCLIDNTGTPSQYDEMIIRIGTDVQNFATSPMVAGVDYTVDIKFDLTDHANISFVAKLDGSTLGTTFSTGRTPWSVTTMRLGAAFSTGPYGTYTDSIRHFTFFKVGSTTYGTSDLFNADFTTLAPFDSLVGTGISLASELDINIPSGASYALKACA